MGFLPHLGDASKVLQIGAKMETVVEEIEKSVEVVVNVVSKIA